MNTSRGALAVAAVARASLLQSIRQKTTWGVVALIVVLVWYDRTYRVPVAPYGWWATVGFAVGLVATISGYDHYDRLRHQGVLRLLLLQGAPRWALVTGYAAAGSAIALAAALSFVLYLLVTPSGLVGADLPRAVLGVALATLAFHVFAQSLSLVLSKDAAAVAVLLVLVFGSSPPTQWLPEGASIMLKGLLSVCWMIIPTPIVVTRFLRGDSGWVSLALFSAQTLGWFALAVGMLHRRALLTRKEA